MVERRGAGGTGDEGPADGPSAEKLRQSIIERVRGIESRHALLAIDAVVSLQEPPFDPALSLEAFLGVAEIVAGMQLVEAAGLQPGEEDDREPS
jgi:hypothetical protein